MRRPRGLFAASDYRKNGRLGPLNAAGFSRVVAGMSFFLSCWFWFARRARRRATGRSDSAGRAVRDRSAAEGASRGRNEQREAQRPPGRGVSGAGTGAPGRNGRRRQRGTRSGGAMPAASVQAFQRDGGSVTARLSKRSRAARSLASARPCGPGRRERSDRSRRATNGSGIADPPRGTKRSDCRVRAAVEASPAPCRAQRRAGADSAGADVTERSAAKWRNDGDGAGWRSAVSCGPLHRTHRRPARPLPTGRSASGGGSRARDRSESAQSWRETCRLDLHLVFRFRQGLKAGSSLN